MKKDKTANYPFQPSRQSEETPSTSSHSSPGPSKCPQSSAEPASTDSPSLTPENIGDSVSVSDWIPLLIELEMYVFF